MPGEYFCLRHQLEFDVGNIDFGISNNVASLLGVALKIMDAINSERLINEVQKHPILYDVTNYGYKDNDRKQNVWQYWLVILTDQVNMHRPIGVRTCAN